MKKNRKRIVRLTFAQLERKARKQGLPVFAVLDLIVHQMLKNN